MNDPSYAVQVGAVAAMLADAGVIGRVALTGDGPAVFDALTRAPDAYPRAEIQNIQAVPPHQSTAASIEVYLTLDLWASGPGGRLQLEQLSDAIGVCFTSTPPSFAGFRLVTSLFQDAKHLSDPDGLTAHSILIWRFGVKAAPAG